MIWCMEEDSAKHLGALSRRNAARRQSANQNNLVESFDSLSRRDDNTLMRLTHLGSGVKRNFTAEKIDYFSWLPTELHIEIIKYLIPNTARPKKGQVKELICSLYTLTALAQLDHYHKGIVEDDEVKHLFFRAIPSNIVLSNLHETLNKIHQETLKHEQKENHNTTQSLWNSIIGQEKNKNPNIILRFFILKSFQNGINELSKRVKAYGACNHSAQKDAIVQIAHYNPNFICVDFYGSPGNAITPLQYAAQRHDATLIDTLIKQGALVNKASIMHQDHNTKETALSLALRYWNINLSLKLINDHKAFLRFHDLLPFTSYDSVERNPCLELLKIVVRHILNGNSDIILEESERSILQEAIQQDNKIIIARAIPRQHERGFRNVQGDFEEYYWV